MICQRVSFGGGFAIVCSSQRRPIKLPATIEEIRAAGWKFAYARDCKMCHTPLQFWWMPREKPKPPTLMPLEATLDGETWVLISHWASCVFADSFRRKKKPAKPATPKTGRLFPE